MSRILTKGVPKLVSNVYKNPNTLTSIPNECSMDRTSPFYTQFLLGFAKRRKNLGKSHMPKHCTHIHPSTKYCLIPSRKAPLCPFFHIDCRISGISDRLRRQSHRRLLSYYDFHRVTALVPDTVQLPSCASRVCRHRVSTFKYN